MTWSYSRLTSFDGCPYGWYLKYIRMLRPEGEQFFSSYGSLIHECLELFLKGEATREELVTKYLTEFRKRTRGETPRSDMKLKYFENGLAYLQNLRPFPFKPLAVEQKVDFQLDGKRFVGVIDCLAEDDTGILIVDHKSHRLKPRSRKANPTETDKELDKYLRQLYLYAVWVVRTLKKKPRKLVFNCFRDGRLIREPFDDGVFYDVQKWASATVDRIKAQADYPPNIDEFRCKYLCDMKEHCEYYQANFGKE
jgi:hypothetical protein